MKVFKNRPKTPVSAKARPAGWNPVQLMKLSNQLDQIIDNFKNLTGSWAGLTLHYSEKSPSARSGLISINHSSWKVTAYLGDSPAKVMAQAPLTLARRLTLLDKEKGSSISVYTAIGLDYHDAWKRKILLCLAENSDHERLAKVNLEVTELLKDGMQKIDDQKITLALFNGLELPARSICAQIEHEMARFREKIMDPCINLASAVKLNVPAEIAHYARLSVFADHLGHPELVSRARQLFSGEAAENLAGTVFGLMSRDAEVDLSSRRYLAESHFRSSVPGFEIQFMAFQKIFHAYYENVTIKYRR